MTTNGLALRAKGVRFSYYDRATRDDLLAINIDEAASLLGLDSPGDTPEQLVQMTIARMREIHPSTMLSVTAGKSGSWTWDGNVLNYVPAFAVEVKSSAGAGDAHIAGIMSGLTAGLTLAEAQKLAGLAAAFSVTSPHTIHPEMSRENLRALAARVQQETDTTLSAILKG